MSDPSPRASPTISASPEAAAVTAPRILSATGCRIEYTEGKGRGVFANCPVPAHALIEVSPVLLLSAEEYEKHGKYTVLDHYTFTWRDGRMAIALGLGSLFNHSQEPNVSFSLDPLTESIRYTTTRSVLPDEELCIFYGHKLWFKDINANEGVSEATEDTDDGWGGLSVMADNGIGLQRATEGDHDLNEIVQEDSLPFLRVRITPDEEEEEDLESVRTVDAWVADIMDNRHTTALLKWLKASGYESPALAHLKRIRKSRDQSTFLLTASPNTPVLPTELQGSLSTPYQIRVPKTAALTPTSLQLKATFWPTVFAPRRKHEPEVWSQAKMRWASSAIRRVIAEARHAMQNGNLPIAAYVPPPFDVKHGTTAGASLHFVAHDLRISAAHPLRHPVLNVIQQISDYRSEPATTAVNPGSAELSAAEDAVRNGKNYLLTSLTLFTTHEPCIMCSMALLHSRVKEVFYIFPMTLTGGCGGAACLPKLPAVNHRFTIGRWKEEPGLEDLRVGDDVDA
ncbi:cytidine deaminase-like protein [Vararia minispora EC-137]|uniref:Cytidine deaminase-like protein n=1 Tax=Vararia minispora EC-137 TaxID=1314806 RepID=A0ACB8QXF3_9AGAM|nr:cytidine deaminase-like protein [Vararia minispora EC-137]